jgi:hypothetical protein
MRDKFPTLAASLTLSAILALSGCKSSAPPANADGTGAPAAPAAAPAAGAPAAPPSAAPAAAPSAATAGAPTAAAPTAAPAVAAPPVAAPPPPPPPPPPPEKRTAPAGAAVVVTVTQQLSASKNNVGDSFSGVLFQSVKTADGKVVFKKGAHVTGTVVAAKGQGKFKGSGSLGIQVNTVAGMPVQVASYEQEQKGKGKRTTGFIAGGAGGGALIGGLAGGGKGALIGGLVGAGAGTAGAAFTGNKDVVIPSETNVSFHLTSPVTITVQPKEGSTEPGPAPLPPQ